MDLASHLAAAAAKQRLDLAVVAGHPIHCYFIRVFGPQDPEEAFLQPPPLGKRARELNLQCELRLLCREAIPDLPSLLPAGGLDTAEGGPASGGLRPAGGHGPASTRPAPRAPPQQRGHPQWQQHQHAQHRGPGQYNSSLKKPSICFIFLFSVLIGFIYSVDCAAVTCAGVRGGGGLQARLPSQDGRPPGQDCADPLPGAATFA